MADELVLPPGATLLPKEEPITLPEGASFLGPESDQPQESQTPSEVTLPPGAKMLDVSDDLGQSVRSIGQPVVLPPGAVPITGVDDGSRDKLDENSFVQSNGLMEGMLERLGSKFIR